MNEALFIPKEEVKPGVQYRGYVATPEGLVHHTKAKTTGHAAKGDVKWRPFTKAVRAPHWEVEPSIRRTPQQRVESLMKRIMYQYEHYGWSESLLDDLVNLTWDVGTPRSREEIRALARSKLGPDGKPLTTRHLENYARAKLVMAEKEADEADSHRVTRKSPHALDPGRGPTGRSRNQGGP